jgi:hypothetical protein
MKIGVDRQSRLYLTFDQAKAGRSVSFDGDFDCVRKGDRRRLRKSPSGLYFRCDCGTHLLDGQEDFDGGRFYVGVYPATTP